MELCLRKSLQLNRSLHESADLLTIHLAEQQQYDAALQVLSDIEPRMADPAPVQGRAAWIRRERGETSKAVNELAETLERFPGYVWGWNLMLDWLELDKDWPRSRKLLASVPAQMLQNLEFRRRRLQLLERAKIDVPTLDAEWSQLLDDFPEEVPLYLHRYDSLRQGSKRWDEAIAVLDRVAHIADDDVYFVARLVDVRCHQERFAEAVDLALVVSFAPVENSAWPVNRAWEVITSTGQSGPLSKGFKQKLENGEQPTRRAIARFVDYLVSSEEHSPFATRLFRQTRLHRVTRGVLSAMQIAMNSSWRKDLHAGDSFAILTTNKYPRLVLRLWRQLQERGLDDDSGAWAEAGRAFVESRQYRRARTHYSEWRTRRGTQMWAIANYMLSIPRMGKRHLREVIDTCRAALDSLPHDHCARYLACLQAEACALLGDKEGVLEIWRSRRAYLDETLASEEYFREADKHLLSYLPALAEALEAADLKRYRAIRRSLRFQRLWTADRRKSLRIVFRIIWVLIVISIAIAGLRR